MKVSDLMQAMSAAGAPMDAILIAVRAVEDAEKRAADAVAAIEAQRAAARDKKRRQRAMSRDNDDDVPGLSRDMSGTLEGQPSLSRPPLSSPQTPQQTPPTHTHPDGNSPQAREPARKAPPAKPAKVDPFPMPEWADPQVWSDFLANRKRKNLTNTATAYAKLLRDIDALVDPEWPPGRLLEAIAARGWAAAYDPRDRNDRQPDRSTNWGSPAGNRRGQDDRTSLQRACDDIIFAGGARPSG